MVSMTVVGFLNTSNVSAVFDRKFYSSNDIIFSNPEATLCGPNKAPVSTLAIALTDTTKKIYDYLSTTPLSSNGGKPLSPAQAAGIMGNMYAESGFNPSAIEDTSRAEKGHGLVQWTFGRWTNLQAYASSVGKPWDDVEVQLGFLKQELEGSEKAVINDPEFNTATSAAIAAQRFLVVFERADPDVANLEKRQSAAAAVFGEYSSTTATSAACSTNVGVVAGDIVKTAQGLALTSKATSGMVNQSDARDTYQEAKMKYNPSVDWTDCGGFIAVVMIASGADPSYPKVYVPTQIEYVRNNPAKYQVIENPQADDLRPGDILLTSGHTTLYTGDASFPSIDASLGDRVPSVQGSGNHIWMLANGAIIARIIK